jgi:Transposase DDE domain
VKLFKAGISQRFARHEARMTRAAFAAGAPEVFDEVTVGYVPRLGIACGDTPEPSAVVIDSRSCRSASSCFARGIDSGKKIRSVKIQMAVEKYSIHLAINVAPANRHGTKAIVPAQRGLADGGFRGSAIGDLGYRGRRLAEAGQKLGITLEAIARGRDGQFIPAGICWLVERSLAWLSRYRRLNIIFERSKEHLIGFVAVAFISNVGRRLKRLVAEELGARRLQTDRKPPALWSDRPLL